MADVVDEALREIAPDPFRYQGCLRRIHVCEEYECPIEKLPMRMQYLQQPVPIQVRAAFSDEVDDIRAVDCKGDASVMQDEEYLAVEFPLFHVPIRLSGGSNRKTLILLHSYFDAIHIRTCRPFS